MTERNDLLESITNTIKDYREGEIEQPTPEHVNTWAKQFDKDIQIPLLHELDYVLKNTYLSKELVIHFLSNLVKNSKLAGAGFCAFWAKAHFLNIQQNGNSQRDMLELFGESLADQCDIEINNCGDSDGHFIYLDDVIFSGSRVGSDLTAWIKSDAPAKAVVHVIVIATHTSGQYFLEKRVCFKCVLHSICNLDDPRKLIAVYIKTNHNIVHLLFLGKANGFSR